MTMKNYRTNLNCESCVAAVAPFLDSEPKISNWKVDLTDERKVLSVSGDSVDEAQLRLLVKKGGFEVLEEIPVLLAEATISASALKTYFPLLLIFAYLCSAVGILQIRAGGFEIMSAMSQFMAGFFLIFSFFKILNLRGFAQAYATYDLLASKVPAYGYIYPFLELGLGLVYFGGYASRGINIFTSVLMFLSSLGVIASLLEKKKIKCACLGTVFNLPMTAVTLVEDVAMVFMALGMLLLS